MTLQKYELVVVVVVFAIGPTVVVAVASSVIVLASTWCRCNVNQACMHTSNDM